MPCGSVISPPTSTAPSATRRPAAAPVVLKPDVLARAIDTVSENDSRPRLLMSPRGKQLTQSACANAGCRRQRHHRLRPLRGGVDQLLSDQRAELEEVSIGDYVLSGGEPAALTVLDAIVRILPGVMGNDLSGLHESFEGGLLQNLPALYPPAGMGGTRDPAILTSGNQQH